MSKRKSAIVLPENELPLLELLADKVIYLMREMYKDIVKNDAAFGLAFIDVANIHQIPYRDRVLKKRQIGSLLGSRPKKPKMTENDVFLKTATIFCVGISDTRSVEFFSKHRIMFKFGKDKNGVPTLFSYSGASQPSERLKKDAEGFAKYFFAQPLAPKEIFGVQGITLKESSATQMVLLIDDTFDALFVPTNKSVAARITQKGAVIRQKDVPPVLMKKARRIALTHFMGAGSLHLDFG